MKTRRWITLQALVLCGLFAAPALRAESPKEGPGDGKWEQKREEKFKEMREKLGLTADQEAKLKAHKESHKAEARNLHEGMRAKRDALRQELEKPAVDESRVRALHNEIKALDAGLSDHRLKGILEVRKILTPEQFKKFHEMMPNRGDWKPGEGRQEKREGRRERRKERRGDE